MYALKLVYKRGKEEDKLKLEREREGGGGEMQGTHVSTVA